MEHFTECPLHEDHEITHECRPERMRRNKDMWGYNYLAWDSGWYLKEVGHRCGCRIDYCPWCGEELPYYRCMCGEIRQGLKERQIEYKTEGRLP